MMSALADSDSNVISWARSTLTFVRSKGEGVALGPGRAGELGSSVKPNEVVVGCTCTVEPPAAVTEKVSGIRGPMPELLLSITGTEIPPPLPLPPSNEMVAFCEEASHCRHSSSAHVHSASSHIKRDGNASASYTSAVV